MKDQKDKAVNSNYINNHLNRGIRDYINEDLDEGVETVGDVLEQIKGTISNKRKGSADAKQKPKLTEELNVLLQRISKKELSEAFAMAEIKKKFQNYSKPIMIYPINNFSNIDSIEKLEKQKKEAICNKDFEKAAYYRDLISELETNNKLYFTALQYDTDAFFTYWIDQVFFVVKKETFFIKEIIRLFEAEK